MHAASTPTPTPTSTPHPHPTPTPAPTPCQVRAKGVHFYKRGLLLEKSDGTVITMRAAGQISLYLPIPPYISLWGDNQRTVSCCASLSCCCHISDP